MGDVQSGELTFENLEPLKPSAAWPYRREKSAVEIAEEKLELAKVQLEIAEENLLKAKRLEKLGKIPLTWKHVFCPDHLQGPTNMDAVRDAAYRAGYPLYAWNGWVYMTEDDSKIIEESAIK